MNWKALYLLVISALCLVSEASARHWRNIDGHAAITGGYRNDKFTSDVDVFDLNDALILFDNIQGESIDLYTIGLKGHLLFCNKWYLRGFVDCGEVCSGKYDEIVGRTDDGSELTKGKITGGHTYDTSVGLGYLFSCYNCFQLGPVAGYAYSYEKYKTGTLRTDGIVDTTLSKLSYDMRWQGPWLGVDAIYTYRCFRFDIGYEYHWCHWHAEWTLDGASVQETAFSDKRKSNDAYGNVVFVNGTYNYCKCWTFGLGFKYFDRTAKDGDLKPQSDSLIITTITDTVPKSTWRAYQVYASLGYNF